VPLGGLVRVGARDESLEKLIVDLSKGGKGGRTPCWGGAGRRRKHRRPKSGKSPIQQALEDAGLVPPESEPPPPPDEWDEPERGETMMKALRTAYAPPWQRALQRWLDAVAPAGRTYSRASRRGADRDDDVILCGRFREGWCLHVVLDTSGSMVDALPKILGT